MRKRRFRLCDPDNPRISRDIFIPQGCDAGAVTGHKVIVKIKDYGNSPDKKPEGVITSILGHMNDPGVDILSIVRAYGLPEEFPPEVMAQLEEIPDAVREEDKAGRRICAICRQSRSMVRKRRTSTMRSRWKRRSRVTGSVYTSRM
ncbi:MAG: hypothetical protein ACLR3S_02745 [Clostridium fessum]